MLLAFAAAAVLHHQALQTELESLARTLPGRVGICVQDHTGRSCVNAGQRFSMQSVMKLLVAAAVMDAVDHTRLALDQPVVVRPEDLSLYIQPIARLVKPGGYRTTIGDLLRRAVVDSDSAATDILIARLGGVAQVQSFLQRNGLTGVRVDRDERHLQTEILGLDWRHEFVDPAVLDRAIVQLPPSVRDAAWTRYLSDPRDTSTPQAMAAFLHRLAQGEFLSPGSTRHLVEVMAQCATFPDRLKAGLAPGWSLAHKTGTSSTWQGITAATNDAGILTAPDSHTIGVAVFIADSPADAKARAALMAAVTRAVIAAYRQPN